MRGLSGKGKGVRHLGSGGWRRHQARGSSRSLSLDEGMGVRGGDLRGALPGGGEVGVRSSKGGQKGWTPEVGRGLATAGRGKPVWCAQGREEQEQRQGVGWGQPRDAEGGQDT